MRTKLLALAFSAGLAFVLAEAGIALGAWLDLFPIKVPSYSLAQAHGRIFWRDMNRDFGVWHVPDSAVQHTKSCFDVTYRSNSYGARDRERLEQAAAPRVVVLGDSMTEGIGVADSQRFTDLLERDTGIEHLNFGTAGSFGTVQYWLLYKTLASKFSHSAVIIAMLPANDFWDNDIEYGKRVYPHRYRPYLVGAYPDYRLEYFQRSLESSTFRDREGPLGFLQRVLAEFTYTYNAFAYFKQLIVVRAHPEILEDFDTRRAAFFKDRPKSADPSKRYSGFYDFRKDQLDIVKYTVAQIKALAGSRDVVIALLPGKGDFLQYDPANPVTPLAAELGKFAAENGMHLVDLLPEMHRVSPDGQSIIHPCDGHWSASGHAVAAQIIEHALATMYRIPAR